MILVEYKHNAKWNRALGPCKYMCAWCAAKQPGSPAPGKGFHRALAATRKIPCRLGVLLQMVLTDDSAQLHREVISTWIWGCAENYSELLECLEYIKPSETGIAVLFLIH